MSQGKGVSVSVFPSNAAQRYSLRYLKGLLCVYTQATVLDDFTDL
ncbi:MAG: hypothetical protein AAGM40_07380 [Cyanobacteria bacterium J06573_2]